MEQDHLMEHAQVTQPRGLRLAAAFTALVVLTIGCDRRDEQIKVYRLAKAPLQSTPPPAEASRSGLPDLPPDHPPIASASSRLPGGASAGAATAAAPSVPVPPNWEPQALSEMRKASYLVHGADASSADVSFVVLGGTAGDILGNVNRWLGQIGRPSMTEQQLPSVVQHLPSELGHVAVVDLHGSPEQGDPKKDGRIMAVIATGDGGTSFFKMRGNTEVVGAEKENFLKWVAAMRELR
jgi:hypothetical protein